MKNLLMTIAFLFLFPIILYGAEGDQSNVTVSWNANIEADLAGYELHYGRESGSYTFKIIMDKRTAYPLVLEQGINYFFALKAFDLSGNVSGFGEELNYTVAIISEGDIEAPATPSTTINIAPGTEEIIINLP